ncbi:MAG: quinone oxidoreductase [Actinomycetota bacterium]|nr:quinone oxidoreductase [Actinomycetota bacterium]
MKAVVVRAVGGPDVLAVASVADPQPAHEQVRVRVVAAGVNFIDTYQRSGRYAVPVPFTPGSEGAGVVDAVGSGVAGLAVGDRVAWATQPGSYAEQVVVPADQLVAVPAEVDLRVAAALMLQGMTAHYLATSTFPLRDGHTALVHAAAGGVGSLLVQIAKRRGARVIGTAGTHDKRRRALDAGADEVVLYREVDVGAAVAELTAGAGVDVVYDSVGADTFDRSLDCLRPRGCLVLFGQSSGPVPPLDPQVLNRKGSLFLTRPSLGAYLADRDELAWRAGDLFAWLSAGELNVRIDRIWPLAEAAHAHRYMEAGKTTGKVLLIP